MTRFAARTQLVTGLYTAGLGLGAVVAVGVSVPLTDAFNSWPAALASWAVLALVGIVLWIGGAGALDLGGAAAPRRPATSGLPSRDRMAWRIAAISALYYCELAWLAPLLHNDGHRSVANSGDLLAIMLVIQVTSMLVVPAVLGEKLDRRVGLTVTTGRSGIVWIRRSKVGLPSHVRDSIVKR